MHGAGEAGEEGFEKIKSRGEKKRDKLLTMDPKEITYDMVNKKLRDISLARGKKGVDRQEQARLPLHEPHTGCTAQGPVRHLEHGQQAAARLVCAAGLGPGP